MKKTIKLFTAFALAAALMAGTLYAQETKKSENPMRPDTEVPARNHLDLRGHGQGRHGFAPKQEDENLIVGKVKTANTKTNVLTITNLDGKDVSLTLTPFTMIHIINEEPPKAPEDKPADNREELTPLPARAGIQDLSKGDWVLISTLNTDTKTKTAARVLVQKQSKPSIDADAK